MEQEPKTCARCRQNKDRSEFTKHRRKSDGLYDYCRLCVSEIRRGRYAESDHRWYRKNRERILAQKRETSNGGREPGKAWPEGWCSYSAAHSRVRAARGSASQHSCVSCNRQAEDWSYRGGSPREVTETRRRPDSQDLTLTYSPDPVDYDPRCRSCHRTLDFHARRTERSRG